MYMKIIKHVDVHILRQYFYGYKLINIYQVLSMTSYSMQKIMSVFKVEDVLKVKRNSLKTSWIKLSRWIFTWIEDEKKTRTYSTTALA